MDIPVCPNCNIAVKSGLLSSNKILSDIKIQVINEYHSHKSSAYCSKCGNDLYNEFEAKLFKERKSLTARILELINAIPVISIQSPTNWEYTVIGMATGQSTTGTGVISEFASSFTDLFGMQSDRFNKKLKSGEEMCFSQIRKQTLDMGGNAVVATDIDYSEVGGDKGILMVCAAGTVIRLINLSIIGNERSEQIKELEQLHSRLTHLNYIDVIESA